MISRSQIRVFSRQRVDWTSYILRKETQLLETNGGDKKRGGSENSGKELFSCGNEMILKPRWINARINDRRDRRRNK